MTVAACPGPHRPTQHRDRKPPWCHKCGRDANGVQQHVVVEVRPDEDVHDWMRRKVRAGLGMDDRPHSVTATPDGNGGWTHTCAACGATGPVPPPMPCAPAASGAGA